MLNASPTETSWWQQPHTRSGACTRILDRIERGIWHPAESTLWNDPAKAAKRAGVHEWEWRNLILHGYCGRLATDPECPWPVERLPHCPSAVYEPYVSRYDRIKYLQALCACQEPDTGRWSKGWNQRAHWVRRHGATGQDVLLFCHCGGPEDPVGSGLRWVNDDGYVCEACAPQLITQCRTWDHREVVEAGHVGEGPDWSHRLKCDCRRCYCGGVAERDRGWRLASHPRQAKPPEGPRRAAHSPVRVPGAPAPQQRAGAGQADATPQADVRDCC